MLLQFDPRDAANPERLPVVRLRFDRARLVFRGAREVEQPESRIAALVVRGGVAGLKLERARRVRNGLLEPLQPVERRGTALVGFGAGLVEPDGAVEVFQSGRVEFRLDARVAAPAPACRGCRVGRDRLAVLDDGLVELAGGFKGLAARDRRCGVLRPRPRDPGRTRERCRRGRTRWAPRAWLRSGRSWPCLRSGWWGKEGASRRHHNRRGRVYLARLQF